MTDGFKPIGEAISDLMAKIREPEDAPRQFVRLTKAGEARVLAGKAGMIFELDCMGGVNDRCAHVRDYRYSNDWRPFQIWTLGPSAFEPIT